MPVGSEPGARVELAEAARRKARKVVARQRVVLPRVIAAKPPIGSGRACYW